MRKWSLGMVKEIARSKVYNFALHHDFCFLSDLIPAGYFIVGSEQQNEYFPGLFLN